MEVNYSVRLQVAALCIVTVVIIDFIKSEKIKLVSTKWFGLMLAIAEIYMFFDISTVYTIVYFKDSIINDLCHKTFYVLMLTCVFSFTIYIELLGNITATANRLRYLTLCAFPYLLSIFGILFGDIEYIANENGVSSTGVASSFLYIGVAFYTIFLFAETIRYRNNISRKNITALRMQLVMWVFALVIQRINPYILLAGFIIAMSLVILYFSFENPSVNIDEPTGTYNRRGFEMFFQQEVNGIGGKPYKAIAMIVDDMPIVISSIGHKWFQLVLKDLAKYMKELFKTGIYRISDNVLVVMVPNNSAMLGEQIKQLENRMSKKFDIGHFNIVLKGHVAIMDCPETVKSVADLEEMINYSSECCGTGFAREINQGTLDYKKRQDTLNRIINHALENDGFDIYYQPIYEVESKSFVSSEALVRLKDKETLGYISPEEFIPISEKNGYIMKLGEIVFRKVCEFIKKIDKNDFNMHYVEVNLSALQIIDENITKVFKGIMDLKGVPPKKINLEITETVAVESESLLANNLQLFKEMGCTFSIDDFGTGYSNLSKMASMNYEIVKLDKSLIWPCFDNERTGEKANINSIIILENVVSMLRELGVKIVAEGIETEAMVKKLSEIGVHYMQGYYFSKPISEEDYIKFMMEANK